MPAPDPDIAILGGGPAGLATGFYAHRAGLDFQVYEASDTVGGNARTLQLGPFRFDTGAHRLHDKDPAVTATIRELLNGDLRPVHAPSQIYWRGRSIDFPLAPFDLLTKLPLSTLARIAWEQGSLHLRSAPAPRSFEDAALQTYGPTLAHLFLLNYSAKLWGAPTDALSPRVAGRRLQRLDIKTFLLEMVGSKRRKTTHLDGSFFYPTRGYGAIFEAVADRIGPARLRTNARITRLAHNNRRLLHLAINGVETVDVQEVVSSLPLPLMLRMLDPAPPAALRATAASLRFRSLRLCVFGLDRPQVSPNASLYFPEARLPFTRLYEPKNRSPYLAPPHQTAVVIEVPCQRGDQWWQMPDDELQSRIGAHLSEMGIWDASEVLLFGSYRLPFAYPILEVGSEQKIWRLLRYLQRFENLHLVGRSARFAYAHVHDLFAGARQTVADLVHHPC